MKVQVAHTQVQGLDAPDQIIRALQYFNERGEVQVIAILRGGGSADDLAAFNDEALVRAVAASKIPVICGVGHEVDESLCDLACDVRASTPSNAAELLTRDRAEEKLKLERMMYRVQQTILQEIERARELNGNKVKKIGQGLITKYIEPMLVGCQNKVEQMLQKILDECEKYENQVRQKLKILEVLNPEKVLSQGYAILSGKISPGELIEITTCREMIKAEVKEIQIREK